MALEEFGLKLPLAAVLFVAGVCLLRPARPVEEPYHSLYNRAQVRAESVFGDKKFPLTPSEAGEWYQRMNTPLNSVPSREALYGFLHPKPE